MGSAWLPPLTDLLFPLLLPPLALFQLPSAYLNSHPPSLRLPLPSHFPEKRQEANEAVLALFQPSNPLCVGVFGTYSLYECALAFLFKKKKMQKEKLLWRDRLSQAFGKGNSEVGFQERKAGFPPH